MRVLVCPTAFKGTLTATAAARAMAAGVREAWPGAEVRVMALSDGGPGLLEAVLGAGAAGATLERVRVSGPLGDPVDGRVLRIGNQEAVMESADACGWERLSGRAASSALGPTSATSGAASAGGGAAGRSPLAAHTLGVGELVRRAMAGGARRVWIGLGGSASTDGGTGLGRAFGFRFRDVDGRALPPGGGALPRLARIEPGDPPEGDFRALCDVEIPLTGPRGAARTFGPQKGATAEEVERLAEGLERLAERFRADLGADVASLPGAGAAGGLGAGCAAFLGARLVPGADWVLRRLRFDEALLGADLLVTGEGAWDETSRAGKIVGRALARARSAGVPALLACGRLESPTGLEREGGLALDGGGGGLDARALAALVASGVRRLTRADAP